MAEKNNTPSMLRRNRKLLLLILTFTSLALLITLIAWMGFTPRDITHPFVANGIKYTNISNVYIMEEYSNILDSRYTSDTSEFIYCLYGKTVESGYLIDEIKETKVLSAEDDYIEYIECTKTNNYLGTIHSHPQPTNPRYIATCDMSDQDLYTFGEQKAPLTAIICGKQNYAFYTPKNFRESLKVYVVGGEQ